MGRNIKRVSDLRKKHLKMSNMFKAQILELQKKILKKSPRNLTMIQVLEILK